MDGRIWAPSGRTAKPSGSIPAQAIDLPERPSSLKRSSAPTTSSPAPGPSATATDSATAELVQEFVAHCDRLRRAGNRTDAKAYAFPNMRGGRLSRRRVAEIVRDAAEQASQRARARPSAHDPAHAAARVRLARAAGQTRFDVLQVMGRVGHAARGRPWTSTPNSSSGFKREHRMAFDRLVDQAREHSTGATRRPSSRHQSNHLATDRAHAPRSCGRRRRAEFVGASGGTRGTVMTRRDARPRLRQTVR